jgi:hypothetical protein
MLGPSESVVIVEVLINTLADVTFGAVLLDLAGDGRSDLIAGGVADWHWSCRQGRACSRDSLVTFLVMVLTLPTRDCRFKEAWWWRMRWCCHTWRR